MKINQLTFTRFLAAISIVIFHYGKNSFPFNNHYIDFVFKSADVCVSYFFILSGFVMLIAYGEKKEISSIEYFKNRFARIFPIYLLGIFLVFLQQLKANDVDFMGMFLNIFMLQAWFPHQVLSFNPPGWSISVELLFYIIFPFVFNNVFKNNNFKKSAIIIILFWILSQIVYQVLLNKNAEIIYISSILRYNPIMHINEFLVGNIAGYYFIKNWTTEKYNLDWVLFLVFCFLIVALKFPLGLNFHNGLLAVFFIPIILLIALNNGFITKLFNKKIFTFLGEISFGIYILQYPVYSIISSYSINKYCHIQDVTTVFYIRLIILIVICSLSYIYIEKPIQTKIKNIKAISN